MTSTTLCFDADHPVFAGHFPARPIVPGVLLLNGAQHAIETATGRTLIGLAAAKFHSPALPGEKLDIEHEIEGSVARFEIRCGARKVASGRFLI